MSEVRLFNAAGQKQDAINLELTFPEKELKSKTYACAVRVLLQNWRQGTVGCKSRGEVAFSNKKPWKQKGTGRARAGSLRSPLWRKGGVIFGPQPRTRTLKINRKQRKACLGALLQELLKKNAICCVDFDFGQDAPKTKKAFELLKNIDLAGKKGVLFLPHDDTTNFAAFRNLPRVAVFSFDEPNAFDLSNTNYWMFLKRDLPLFKDMVAKWI